MEIRKLNSKPFDVPRAILAQLQVQVIRLQVISTCLVLQMSKSALTVYAHKIGMTQYNLAERSETVSYPFGAVGALSVTAVRFVF